MFRRFIMVGIVLSLAACAGDGMENFPRSKVATARKMVCEGDTAPLQGYYTVYSPSEIGLSFGDKNFALKRERSASGAKYKNASAMFWNKGIDGLLEIKGGESYTCRFLPDDVAFQSVPASNDLDVPAAPAPAVMYEPITPVNLEQTAPPTPQVISSVPVPLPPQKPTSVLAKPVSAYPVPLPPVKPARQPY